MSGNTWHKDHWGQVRGGKTGAERAERNWWHREHKEKTKTTKTTNRKNTRSGCKCENLNTAEALTGEDAVFDSNPCISRLNETQTHNKTSHKTLCSFLLTPNNLFFAFSVLWLINLHLPILQSRSLSSYIPPHTHSPFLSPCGFCHLFTDEWPLHRHDLNVSHPCYYVFFSFSSSLPPPALFIYPLLSIWTSLNLFFSLAIIHTHF